MNRIAKSVVFWMIISVPMLGVGQKAAFSTNVSDCSGAIQMETNRVLKPKIPIKLGEVDDLLAYSKNLKLPETNSLWFKFESPHTGWLKLTLQKVDIPIEYGVFILKRIKIAHQSMMGLLLYPLILFWISSRIVLPKIQF